MFVRTHVLTPTAAVCITEPAPPRAPAPETLWAEVPFQTRHGACLGLRLRKGRLEICVREGSRRSWRPVAGVLTTAQAALWARGRFTAPRR